MKDDETTGPKGEIGICGCPCGEPGEPGPPGAAWYPAEDDMFEPTTPYPMRHLLREILDSDERIYVPIEFAQNEIFTNTPIDAFCREFGIEYQRIDKLPEQGLLDRPFRPYYEFWLIEEGSVEEEIEHSHLP